MRLGFWHRGTGDVYDWSETPCKSAMAELEELFRREATADNIFCHDSRVKEVEQIVRAASFGAAARHVEAAEGMTGDESTGDSTVDVKVARAKLPFHALDIGGAAREETTGERIWGAVSNPKSVVQVGCPDDGKDGTENLLLRNTVIGPDAGEDNGTGEESVTRRGSSLEGQVGFISSRRNVSPHFFQCGLIDEWSDFCGRFGWIPNS